MGLYEEAVDLALKVGMPQKKKERKIRRITSYAKFHITDIELAKINADKPDDDEALRKKLWLRIARHVVQERKGILCFNVFLFFFDFCFNFCVI